MAKFVTDDGIGGISGDKLLYELNNCNHDSCVESFNPPIRKRHADVDKMHVPVGDRNFKRLSNCNMYDLLVHMQQTLSLTGRCVLEILTNEDHKCINMNPVIQHRINLFARKRIDESFREIHPKCTVRFKNDPSDNEYSTRLETDDEWNDRLCHMYMHQYHSSKLQMIKCEECLQRWMNDDKW